MRRTLIMAWAGVTVAAMCAAADAGRADRFTFDPAAIHASGLNTTGIDAADLDGDGDLDLVTSNRDTNDIRLFYNAGQRLTPGPSVPAGVGPRYVVAAAFSTPGTIDLATVGEDDTLRLFRPAFGGGYEPGPVLPVFRPSWLTACDVDDDGDLDLLVTHLDANVPRPGGEPACLTAFVNDGAGGFSEGATWPVGVFPRGGAVADFDADGRADIAVTNLLSNDVTILFGSGRGLEVRQTVGTDLGPRYAAASDVDGDGDIDLAIVHKDTDRLWVLRNDGAGGFSTNAGDRYAVGNSPHGIVAADLDGDGDDDLAIAPVAKSWLDLLENDGTGRFALATIASPGGSAHLVAVDLDGNGTPDLATADSSAGTMTVHANRSSTAGARSVIHVRTAPADGGDGTTWSSAVDLATAIDPAFLAGRPQPIALWLEQGPYTPPPLDDDPRAATVAIPLGVSVYGGFAGFETSVWARPDAPHEPTTLSGDLAGDDDGTLANRSDNAYRVVSIDNALPGIATRLDGLAIVGGEADAGSGTGAGLAATLARGTILCLEAVTFEGNRATGAGGAAWFGGEGDVEIAGSRVIGNSAASGGGLAFTSTGVLQIDSIELSGNVAGLDGGGLWRGEGSGGVNVRSSSIAGNVAGGDGGGLAFAAGGPVTIAQTTFERNRADRGGGQFSDATTLTVMLTTWTDQEATLGGAIYVSGGELLLHAARVTGNSADLGSAVYTDGGGPAIDQTTIADNTGVAIHVTSRPPAYVAVDNSILWNDAGGEISLAVLATAEVRHSIVAAGWPGPGNLDLDPLFDGEAYRLAVLSPAIDGGDSLAVVMDTLDLDGDGDQSEPVPFDLDGNTRFAGAAVDLGVYETQFCPGDVNGDHSVGFVDLLAILIFWGPCSPCPADLNGDGVVDFVDLVALLSLWGECPDVS